MIFPVLALPVQLGSASGGRPSAWSIYAHDLWLDGQAFGAFAAPWSTSTFWYLDDTAAENVELPGNAIVKDHLFRTAAFFHSIAPCHAARWGSGPSLE